MRRLGQAAPALSVDHQPVVVALRSGRPDVLHGCGAGARDLGRNDARGRRTAVFCNNLGVEEAVWRFRHVGQGQPVQVESRRRADARRRAVERDSVRVRRVARHAGDVAVLPAARQRQTVVRGSGRVPVHDGFGIGDRNGVVGSHGGGGVPPVLRRVPVLYVDRRGGVGRIAGRVRDAAKGRIVGQRHVGGGRIDVAGQRKRHARGMAAGKPGGLYGELDRVGARYGPPAAAVRARHRLVKEDEHYRAVPEQRQVGVENARAARVDCNVLRVAERPGRARRRQDREADAVAGLVGYGPAGEAQGRAVRIVEVGCAVPVFHHVPERQHVRAVARGVCGGPRRRRGHAERKQGPAGAPAAGNDDGGLVKGNSYVDGPARAVLAVCVGRRDAQDCRRTARVDCNVLRVAERPGRARRRQDREADAVAGLVGYGPAGEAQGRAVRIVEVGCAVPVFHHVPERQHVRAVARGVCGGPRRRRGHAKRKQGPAGAPAAGNDDDGGLVKGNRYVDDPARAVRAVCVGRRDAQDRRRRPVFVSGRMRGRIAGGRRVARGRALAGGARPDPDLARGRERPGRARRRQRQVGRVPRAVDDLAPVGMQRAGAVVPQDGGRLARRHQVREPQHGGSRSRLVQGLPAISAPDGQG